MGIAAAALMWRPSDFWSATPHEFHAAWEAYAAMNTVKT